MRDFSWKSFPGKCNFFPKFAIKDVCRDDDHGRAHSKLGWKDRNASKRELGYRGSSAQARSLPRGARAQVSPMDAK